MSKKIRQYVGLLAAILCYYIIHEGAHLLYALFLGVFKTINFLGLGVQIDVYRENMTDTNLGIFCLVGAVSTMIAAYVLTAFREKICEQKSKLLRAVFYYITIIMLFMDPVYLGILCGFFGGGDMNGISLLIPEIGARVVFILLLAVNTFVFVKLVLPAYTKSFAGESDR